MPLIVSIDVRGAGGVRRLHTLTIENLGPYNESRGVCRYRCSFGDAVEPWEVTHATNDGALALVKKALREQPA